jgi:hypothetical protein
VDREIARIDAQIKRLRERRRFLRRMPIDHYPDGTVVAFTKRFSEDSHARTYRYAAIKAEGLWYTSGPKRNGPWLWEDLMRWIQGDLDSLKVFVSWDYVTRPNAGRLDLDDE